MTGFRGDALPALSHATMGAFALCSIQGKPDAEALQLIEQAIGDLLEAVVLAMDAVGVSVDETERCAVYEAAKAYVGVSHG